jgi:hypothetical protein
MGHQKIQPSEVFYKYIICTNKILLYPIVTVQRLHYHIVLWLWLIQYHSSVTHPAGALQVEFIAFIELIMGLAISSEWFIHSSAFFSTVA